MASSTIATNVVPAPVANPTAGSAPPATFRQRLAWFGGKVLDIAERVGEGVVSFLGLDESHFQDVLDNMTEEEMAAAVEVNNRRNEEYKQAGILPMETELPPDLTLQDIAVELFSSPTKTYTMVEGGRIIETDIENGNSGLEMRPTMSMTRTDLESGGHDGPSPAAFVRVSTVEDSADTKQVADVKPSFELDPAEAGDMNL